MAKKLSVLTEEELGTTVQEVTEKLLEVVVPDAKDYMRNYLSSHPGAITHSFKDPTGHGWISLGARKILWDLGFSE